MTPAKKLTRLALLGALGMCGPVLQCLAQAGTAEPMPKFDAAYMKSAANIKAGQAVWVQQCRHCHGNSAYPGKAPKLNPAAMDAEHIFDRVTYGFRQMPAWKDVFSIEQRKSVVAYIKSSEFTP